MGSIRTLLAISVVFAHTYGFIFVGGQLAVQLFYIISGFLIYYILVEKKSYISIKAFFKNRFLRLFPIYWVVVFLTIFIYLIQGYLVERDLQFIQVFSELDIVGKIFIFVSNIFIVGQDWIMFTAFNDGVFHFTTDFRETDVNVYDGLIVPQAWTLGVEISFYLVAPLILHSKRLLFFLLFASIIIRAYLFSIGLGLQDPWSYRFFPTELALFLLGAISHKYFKPYYVKLGLMSDMKSVIVSFAVFVYCCLLFVLPYKLYFGIFLIALFILSLPFLFHFQSIYKWDRRIGDLSYPIYISHMLVVVNSEMLLGIFDIKYTSILGSSIIVIATIVISFLLNLTVGKYIESKRDKVKTAQAVN